MKTDSIFYRLFQSFPGIFFELIDKSPQLADIYKFSSVEVKQLAFRIDGVFLPDADALEIPIYFTEVQFQADKKFYSRFFAEIFNYLNQTQLTNDWRGVVIFPSRSVDIAQTKHYVELLNSERVTRVYLDELSQTRTSSIGIETVKLVVESEKTAATKAKELINFVREQSSSEIHQRELIELIETIIVYKFPLLSRKEIEQMLGLGELKKTKVYQEAFEEGKLEGKIEAKLEAKLEMIPRLLAQGLNIKQTAEVLRLDEKIVKQVVEKE